MSDIVSWVPVAKGSHSVSHRRVMRRNRFRDHGKRETTLDSLLEDESMHP